MLHLGMVSQVIHFALSSGRGLVFLYLYICIHTYTHTHIHALEENKHTKAKKQLLPTCSLSIGH